MPAVGSTYLQIVNWVLRRLRESTMTDFSAPTANQQMIMDLVNTVKAEVENAWYWDALRDTYQITTTANIIAYSFTGAGSKARILDAFNATSGGEITKGSNFEFDNWYLTGQTVQTGYVGKYITNSVSTGYDLKIDVYPKPNSSQVLNFNLYVPQADLSATTDVPKVPPILVLEGTLAYALAERAAEDAQVQLQRYQRLMADEVAADAGRNPEETTWTPV